ncbi:hypothetical protein ACN47E_010024 [Coniothyrium glycines]
MFDAAMPPPSSKHKRLPTRQTAAVVLHFDYDCFYASVFEHETPSLKSLPLAVQQKQIVVTCNYEARRRGLYKLQLITEAKKMCPDVVIVLGEDLTRFRNASKELYAFLRSFSWNSRCERLGFDEVFLDVTDIIDFNANLLNANSLNDSFFHLSRDNPISGFAFDARNICGNLQPEIAEEGSNEFPCSDQLRTRLLLATVGISTNKLLSKLVGSLDKPDGQTTLLPPYTYSDNCEHDDNVTTFLGELEIGKLPGIGFKIAQKLRAHVLQRPAEFDSGLVYGGTKEHVRVYDVTGFPGMDSILLENILGGPGAPYSIGVKIWNILNGCDDSPVGQARNVPRQISVEDSYLCLETIEEVTKELRMLAESLLKRMYADLLEEDYDHADIVVTEPGSVDDRLASKRWLAHPRTIRLSTRPRPPRNPDGSRDRSFARVSRSAPMPTFVFSLKISSDEAVERLVRESLLPLFRRLYPEKRGWNLSLINVAVTNMADAASEKGGMGRDIGRMFRIQDDVLKQWRVEGHGDMTPEQDQTEVLELRVESTMKIPRRGEGSEDVATSSQNVDTSVHNIGESDDEETAGGDAYGCEECGAMMPVFAMGAHARWHTQQ